MSNNQSNGNGNSSNTSHSGQSGHTQQNDSNRNPNNGRNVNPKPTIPEEVGTPDCPVCLSRVENRAYTNTCLHEFCLPCIKEWSTSHNRCPVCREVYQKILYNIRSKQDYDEEAVAEPPDPSNGLLIIMGNMGLLVTPQHTGLYVINPVSTPQGIHYSIEFFGPNNRIFLPHINPQMVMVTPERLEETLQEMNAHPHHPHHGHHPSWLRRHTHNH